MDYVLKINMALQGAAAVFLLLLGMSLFWGRTGHRRRQYLAYAVLTHFAALCLAMLGGVELATPDGAWAAQACNAAAYTMEALSAAVFAICVLSDSDGTLRFKNRKEHVSVDLLAIAVVPVLIALSLETLLVNIKLLGITYALTLQAAYYWILTDREQTLNEREAAVSVQQSRMLAEQMRPHFIFNSLASIEALVQLDPDLATEAIENFSGYLRGHIDSMMTEDLIPFDKELEHIEEFIALEQVDPNRNFTVEYNLGVREFKIPALSLQPIVENAVVYGALSRRDGTGKVTLTTERVGQFIRIVVEDNGVGPKNPTEKQKTHVSVGIANAEERIKAQCGGTFHFALTDDGARTTYLIPAEVSSHA